MFTFSSGLPPPPPATGSAFRRCLKPYAKSTIPSGASRRERVHSFNRKGNVVSVGKVEGDAVDIESLPLPEGKYGWPIIGEMPDAFTDGDFALKRVEKYGPIFKSHYFGSKTVFICGFDNIQQGMVEMAEGLTAWGTKAMEKAVGEKAAVRLDGEEHQFVRKAAYPAFSPSAVDGYVPSIVDRATEFLDKWASQDSILFNPEMKAFAFYITAQSIIGLTYGELSEEEVLDAFSIWWDGVFTFPIDLPFTRFGRTIKTRKMLGGLIQQNIERGQRGEVPSGTALAIMQAVDDNGRKITNKQLEDTIFTLLIAGYDTTASAAGSALIELAKHPEVVEKLRSEQKEVMSKFGSEVSPRCLRAMPYLEAVIKEALRVAPVIPAVVRKVVKTMEFKGYKIPKGWNVVFAITPTIKNMDDRWPRDTEFNPDRFLTEEGRKVGSFMPFGIGPHSCLGNILAMVELKIVFALLFRGYDFEVENVDPECKYLPMTEPHDGLPVKFKRQDLGLLQR